MSCSMLPIQILVENFDKKNTDEFLRICQNFALYGRCYVL